MDTLTISEVISKGDGKNFYGYDVEGQVHDLQKQGGVLYRVLIGYMDGKLEWIKRPITFTKACNFIAG